MDHSKTGSNIIHERDLSNEQKKKICGLRSQIYSAKNDMEIVVGPLKEAAKFDLLRFLIQDVKNKERLLTQKKLP